MEEYINQTRAFLGIIQSIMSEQERNNSAAAADELYEQLRIISEKYNMNIREMMNTQLAVAATVLQLATEQMEDVKEKEAK